MAGKTYRSDAMAAIHETLECKGKLSCCAGFSNRIDEKERETVRIAAIKALLLGGADAIPAIEMA
jgi:hypothetical protein